MQPGSHTPITGKTAMESPVNIREGRVNEEITETRNFPSFTASRDQSPPFQLKPDRDPTIKSTCDADTDFMAGLDFPYDWPSTTESKTKAFFEKLSDSNLNSGNKNLAGMQLSPRLTTMNFGTKVFLRSVSHPVTPEVAAEDPIREVMSLETFLLASCEDKSKGFLLRPHELLEKDHYLITRETPSIALAQLPSTQIPTDMQNKGSLILLSRGMTLQQSVDKNDFLTPATWPAVVHTPPRLVRKPSTGPNLPSTAFSQDNAQDWATMETILRDDNDYTYTTPPPPPPFHMTSSDIRFEKESNEFSWIPPPTLSTPPSSARSNVNTPDRTAFEKG